MATQSHSDICNVLKLGGTSISAFRNFFSGLSKKNPSPVDCCLQRHNAEGAAFSFNAEPLVFLGPGPGSERLRRPFSPTESPAAKTQRTSESSEAPDSSDENLDGSAAVTCKLLCF